MEVALFENEITKRFQEGNYYLGCQLGFISNCYMFIDFSSKRSTERGNIEVYNDGTLNWFYTKNTNTKKQTFITDLKKTPKWFQQIHSTVYEVHRLIAENNITCIGAAG
ncbi:hypothetical protein SFC65_24340 [Priestia filamentosa]|uniref:hypothetical protein n=1 Tax=Priestia filamentosa TaxID=1402861 RepID=UPI003981D79C